MRIYLALTIQVRASSVFYLIMFVFQHCNQECYSDSYIRMVAEAMEERARAEEVSLGAEEACQDASLVDQLVPPILAPSFSFSLSFPLSFSLYPLSVPL